MTLMMLLQWWNLIYLVPFGLALIYLALFVFTGITFGEADADSDLDAHAGQEFQPDADSTVHVEGHVVDGPHGDVDAPHGEADTDLSGEHAVGHALEHAEPVTHAHAGATANHSVVHDLLSFMGIGKIPLSLALMILLLCWGAIGFALNALLVPYVGTILIGLITLPVTLIISIALTGACAALIGKVIPLADSKAQRREELVGKTGDAIYDIDETFGMAAVRNNTGDLFQVPCQTSNGTRIPKGSRVVLFEYDRQKKVFHAALFAT